MQHNCCGQVECVTMLLSEKTMEESNERHKVITHGIYSSLACCLIWLCRRGYCQNESYFVIITLKWFYQTEPKWPEQ